MVLSYRQVSLFFSFYSFLFSYWIISKVLSCNLYILFFCLIHPAVSVLCCIFLLLTEFFSSRFSVWFYFMISISLLSFSFCSCTVSWFHWIVSLFFCGWLDFLKTILLNYFTWWTGESPSPWVQLLENYCDPLVLCFLDFFLSLKVLHCCLYM